MQPDPVLGWSLRPGVEGWFGDEGRAYVSVNAHGQRDRPRRFDKPEATYRIAVLGDAYSEAMHVPLERTYWAQLGERLESCGFQHGKRIEVLNFGVRGYGTAQAYLMLERRALRYRPDLVLLQFTNGSDVRDNLQALDQAGRARPYFRLEANGELRLDDSFVASPAFARRAGRGEALAAVLDHSRLLQLGRDLGSELRGRTGSASPRGEIGLEPAVLAEPQAVLGEPQAAQWHEAWRVTERLLLQMHQLAARNGAELAVFVVPYALEVHPDPGLRAAALAKYGVPDLAYPDRRVTGYARQIGVAGIPLFEEMRALAARKGRALYGFDNRYPGFGHWNELGHGAAAQTIARSLCERTS